MEGRHGSGAVCVVAICVVGIDGERRHVIGVVVVLEDVDVLRAVVSCGALRVRI